MSIAETLSDRYRRFTEGLDPKRLAKGVIVAFSGGPDSRVLLDIASKAHKTVYAYYFIHNIRNTREQSAELDLVSSICQSYGIKLGTGMAERGQIIEQGKMRGIGTEARARELRYSGLSDFCTAMDAGYVLTAHTKDDDMETLIMRFFTGQVPPKGIPSVRGIFCRPLLNTNKDEILEYICAGNFEFSLDSTNESEDYLRNRIRSGIVPRLKDIFPGFAGSVGEIKERYREISEFIDFAVNRMLPWMYIEERAEWEIDASLFCGVPRYARIASLLDCIHKMKADHSQRIPVSFFNDLPDVIENERSILKGHGVLLERRKEKLVLRNDSFDSDNEYVYIVSCGDTITAGATQILLDVKAVAGWEHVFSLPDTGGKTLFLRSRRPGDFIFSGNSRRSLKKMLGEWNIPYHKRNSVPVLTDGMQVLAVLASYVGGKNQLCNTLEKATMADTEDKIRLFLMVRGV